MTNSRLKDYFDLAVLLDRETLDAGIMAGAIAATFTRRGTPVPNAPPVGLTDEFAMDPSRQAMWHAFIKKNDLAHQALSDTVTTLRCALEPALLRAVKLSDQTR
jgi:hypothetical protein